ncbi:MAG: hypothetical protein AB7S70_16490, partial [Hyphomicrobium sp.]
MSGSYDRPDRPPPMRGFDPHRQPEYDPYEDMVTQGGRTASSYAQERTDYERTGYDIEPVPTADVSLRSEFERPTRPDPYLPPRGNTRKMQSMAAPIVPAGSVTGRSLTLVITIMCFLACLTVGAV